MDPHDVIVELTSDSLSEISERECVGEPAATGRSGYGTGNFLMEEKEDIEMLMSNRTPGANRPQPVGHQQVRKSMRDKDKYMKGAGSQKDHRKLDQMPRGRAGPGQERAPRGGHASSNAAPSQDLFDRRGGKSPFGSARKQAQPKTTQKPNGTQLVNINRSNLERDGDSGAGEVSDDSMEVDSSAHQQIENPRKPTSSSVLETLEARAPSKRGLIEAPASRMNSKKNLRR